VAHHDLKCANVIVMPEGQAKALDFGRAKRVSGKDLVEATTLSQNLSQPGVVVGALAYMALNSCAILSHAPAPLPPETPAELRAVIERCLEKEPGRRHQRGGEVRAVLEAIQSGSAIPGLLRSLRLRGVNG
jgi:hypothetical protein